MIDKEENVEISKPLRVRRVLSINLDLDWDVEDPDTTFKLLDKLGEGFLSLFYFNFLQSLPVFLYFSHQDPLLTQPQVIWGSTQSRVRRSYISHKVN